MIGAIAGDIIGSVYEFQNIKTKEFELFDKRCFFTDDTVLTVALAEAILNKEDYAQLMKRYYLRYPAGGYGGNFHRWAASNSYEPYNSWGNGAAMRISAAGYAYESLDEVLKNAKSFTEVTHNHPEGIKGAQATAAAIFMGRTGSSKDEIKRYVENAFNYDLSRSIDEIRPDYHFDVSCQGTVPEALISFLESTDYEDAIRNAISLGGDSDTLACITGGISEAFYGGVPEHIANPAYAILDDELRGVVLFFEKQYPGIPI